ELYTSRNSTSTSSASVLLSVRGGIGNQLFQFACAYALARKFGWPLYIHVPSRTTPAEVVERSFSLDHFHVPIHSWNRVDDKWISERQEDIVQLEDRELLGMTERHPSISAHKIVQLSPKDYCQSETFFEPYRSEIVTLFQLKPTPLHSNNNTALFHHYHTLITSTSSTSSIAVHIRRGDFVSTGNAVPLSYYVDGITYFNSVFKNPTFFIFSDEILTPKDKEKLGLEKNFCYVEGLNSAIMDFELMTICSHGLIGNTEEIKQLS
ncbi:O-antigen biosynthesis glycosyltransferase WbnK, partial [Folsomia candida]